MDARHPYRSAPPSPPASSGGFVDRALVISVLVLVALCIVGIGSAFAMHAVDRDVVLAAVILLFAARALKTERFFQVSPCTISVHFALDEQLDPAAGRTSTESSRESS